MNINKYQKIILEVLDENKVHPNAQELFKLVKDKYPEVGMATIYRNLDKLAMSGQVLKFHTGEKYDRYDGTITDHYHMLCEKCGKVYDVPQEVAKDIDKRTEDLTGYKIISHNLTFVGICDKCKQNI